MLGRGRLGRIDGVGVVWVLTLVMAAAVYLAVYSLALRLGDGWPLNVLTILIAGVCMSVPANLVANPAGLTERYQGFVTGVAVMAACLAMWQGKQLAERRRARRSAVAHSRPE